LGTLAFDRLAHTFGTPKRGWLKEGRCVAGGSWVAELTPAKFAASSCDM